MKYGIVVRLALGAKNNKHIFKDGDKITSNDVNNFESLVLDGGIKEITEKEYLGEEQTIEEITEKEYLGEEQTIEEIKETDNIEKTSKVKKSK